MRKRKKIVLWVVFAIVGGMILLKLLFPGYLLGCLYWISRGVAKEQRRATIRVLYETDHQALLGSCREILDESEAGKWQKGRMYGIREDPDPDASAFPDAIENLNPSYIEIYREGFVRIEMMGAMHHFGVCAFPKDFKNYQEYLEDTDKELIEGLWYYDDGCREDPNYEQYLESLRSKKKYKMRTLGLLKKLAL